MSDSCLESKMQKYTTQKEKKIYQKNQRIILSQGCEFRSLGLRGNCKNLQLAQQKNLITRNINKSILSQGSEFRTFGLRENCKNT